MAGLWNGRHAGRPPARFLSVRGRSSRELAPSVLRMDRACHPDAAPGPLRESHRLMTQTYDVLIAGGGLAGLSLARQLTREAPSLRVFLAEKRAHPVPEAAFKVGESSVEIGAHYFQCVLGLEPHLRDRQLEKLGLRYFFPANGNHRVEERFELGPSGFPPVPSFQLDPGRIENILLSANRDAGVDVRDECRVPYFESV